MAQRFEATATGLLDGYDYRVEIYDSRYTNTSIEGTLGDERQWITWNVGEGDDDGTRPVRPHEFQLSLIETTDVSPLRSAAEDDIRIDVYHDATNTLVYKGYISPNRIATRPLGLQPDVVVLQGTEGLPLLRKSTVDALSWAPNSNTPVAIMESIRTILNELYPVSIPLEVGTNWYPAGGSLTSSDLSLQNRNIFPDTFREDRDEGDFITLYDALKNLLRPFGLSVQQSRRLGGVAWWIVSWDAYKSDGHIDTWEIQPDGTTTYRGDQDVVVDLDALSNFQIEGGDAQPENDPGGPGRRRQEVAVTYDHPPVENFIQEAGFEDGGTEWIISNANINAFVTNHGNFSQTPAATANNQNVGVMDYDTEGSVTDSEEYGFTQDPIFHVRPKSDAGLLIQWSGYQNSFIQARMRVENGGVWFTDASVGLRAGSLPGEVALPVDALTAPIDKGVTVPIWDGSLDRYVSGLKLTERAGVGDEELVGDLEKEVKSSHQAFYVEPTSTSGASIRVNAFIPPNNKESWGRRQFYVPYQDSSGNRLPDNNMKIDLGVNMYDPSPLDEGVIRWFFDDVTIRPIESGQPLDETVSTASVTEVGRVDKLEQVIGSGPGRNTVSRIENGFRWGIGPNPTTNYPISELRARQRERYFRQQNDRYTMTLLVEDQNPQLVGHETVRLNGDIHRVMAVESQPSRGRIQVTLLQHNDYGTS